MTAVRRIGSVVAVVFVAGISSLGWVSTAAADVKPGTASGATVVKAGWWWRANETPADGGGVVAPPEPPATTVPEGTLPTSASAGDPEKVSALEFALNYGPGATVTSMELTLREAADPGANVNADGADTKVKACPVTESFWVDGAASKWSSLPDYDCELAAAVGERDSKGVWTFDLTSMASQWLATGSTMSPSLVLVEDVAAPTTFQVAYDGVAKKGVGVKLVATGGAPPPPPSTGPIGGTGGTGSADLGGTGGGVPADPGGVSGDVPTGEGVPADAEVPAVAGAKDDAPTPALASPRARLLTMFEDLPGGLLVLIPLALGAAYLVMLALGPNGEPALAGARHGVSRALDRMRAGKGSEETS